MHINIKKSIYFFIFIDYEKMYEIPRLYDTKFVRQSFSNFVHQAALKHKHFRINIQARLLSAISPKNPTWFGLLQFTGNRPLNPVLLPFMFPKPQLRFR